MSTTCLVVLTDSLYLNGTIRTLRSWQARNPNFPVIALSRDPIALQSNELASLCQERVLIDAQDYSDISPYKKSRSKRHAQTFFKFEAFRDFGYERNIFLDSDVLSLREAPALYANNQSPLLAARDTGFRKTRGYKGHPNEMNSGVLSIGRSLLGQTTVEQLKAIARENPGRSGYNSGDQGILNKWIHSYGIPLEALPPEYNLIKKDYTDTSGLESCRLLHYCDRKPWFPYAGERGELEALWHNFTDEQR
ncbi:glycosyltransferase [Pelagicoccus enzymogenes]|uniref:glycosyltransferase n=1 Tax=Pelagicoccus enzymogenes TaxID=2773457 RepID=UPI00280D8A69|nr:glycosyltransferase [Pelagicoccus enzymogenes]MDQ8197167.1 glycosyltransferase [Pelagicoccus enzymogenes]